MRDSVIIYADYREHLDLLTLEERGQLFTAILDYVKTGQTEELNPGVKMALSFIKSQIERDKTKYDATCDRNRLNGAKGGRPPQDKTERVLEKPKKPSGLSGLSEKPKKPDNDIDTDTEYDTEYEHDTKRERRASARHARGEYGWVKLTDEEYERLNAEYGAETTACYIAVVDELAQQTGNKNKWKDWNLTVRKAIRDRWGSRDAPSPVKNYRGGGEKNAERDRDVESVCNPTPRPRYGTVL